MENLIIEYVRKNPGMRKRAVASGIGVLFTADFLKTFTSLVKNGILREVDIREPANMEFFSRYYINE